MAPPKTDKEKVKQTPADKAEKTSTSKVSESGEPQEIALLRKQLLALLREHTEIVQSKKANRISDLRIRLRDLGATDIP